MGELRWARRFMRRAGSLVERNDFVPQPWHIQNPAPGTSVTYCGVNVLGYVSEETSSPIGEPPEGAVCARCLRQYDRGRPLPRGGGPRIRRGLSPTHIDPAVVAGGSEE